MITPRREHLWAIVLAGGEGTRLRTLTTNSHGQVVPKQFCSFDGVRSLLGTTLERAARLVDRDRIVVVVTEPHRRWWEAELADLPERNVVVQPHGRGTVPGLLLPLLEVTRRDPEAVILVLPSDHLVEREDVLGCALEQAASAADERRDRVVLLGMVPDRPETDYGWIVAAPATDGCTHHVAAFVEKPDDEVARELLERGAFWNALLLVAAGSAMLQLYQRALPVLLRSLRGCVDARVADPEALEDFYAGRPSQDFSRDVLERFPDCLRLLIVPPCGWTDVGTPARVARCLVAVGRSIVNGPVAGGPRPDFVVSLRDALGAAPGAEGGWSREDYALL